MNLHAVCGAARLIHGKNFPLLLTPTPVNTPKTSKWLILKIYCLFCLMKQNICCGYFAFDGTQIAEMVTWLAQYRDTTCWGLKLWFSIFFAKHRQTATKSLPTFKLDITVSHVCRSCIPNMSYEHFKQMCAATDKITSELFLCHEAK